MLNLLKARSKMLAARDKFYIGDSNMTESEDSDFASPISDKERDVETVILRKFKQRAR